MTVYTIALNPQAQKDEVIPCGMNGFKISSTCTPREGKANRHMIKLLANYLNVSPSKLIVTQGERWNEKTIVLID